MPRALQPMLPLAELWGAYGLDHAITSQTVANQYGQFGLSDARPAGVTVLAELAGVSKRQVQRWRHDGIPLSIAEDICDTLGLHPCEVWGDTWIEAVLSMGDDEDIEAWRFLERRYRQWRAQQERNVSA